jgi:hypothetical protein
MEIKRRGLFMIYFLSIITIGIYYIYWLVQTKEEMNSLGADIPTGWLIIIPIANIWWVWNYCEGFSKFIKKDNNEVLWFILWMIISIIIPAIVQSELNKIATKQ